MTIRMLDSCQIGGLGQGFVTTTENASNTAHHCLDSSKPTSTGTGNSQTTLPTRNINYHKPSSKLVA